MSKEQNILSLYKLNEREKKELYNRLAAVDKAQDKPQPADEPSLSQTDPASGKISTKKKIIIVALIIAAFMAGIGLTLALPGLSTLFGNVSEAESSISDVESVDSEASVQPSTAYTYDESTCILSIYSDDFDRDDIERFALNNAYKVIIYDGVTKIHDNEFSDFYYMRSIDIPESVTYIGKEAFKNCIRLNNITIPESVNYVRENVFVGWQSDQTIYIERRSSLPSEWSMNWNYDCEAKVVWNAWNNN